ncbi:hypothetical protein U1Q18_008807, partial [Sarracenia purpurea var. burkii]
STLVSLPMKSSRKTRSHYSFTTTVTYTFQNDHSTPHPQTKSIGIPPEYHSDSPVQYRVPSNSLAAVKIQSAFRSYRIRTLVNKISAVNSEATRLERLIQRQETVDAIRADAGARMKMNEDLMGLLLRLDAVPGRDQALRELRRHVSRRIVGLQEILDGLSDARVEDYWDGFVRNWDDVIEKMEEDACRERGGDEMERFCAQHLGFRCLQRFLRDH